MYVIPTLGVRDGLSKPFACRYEDTYCIMELFMEKLCIAFISSLNPNLNVDIIVKFLQYVYENSMISWHPSATLIIVRPCHFSN